MQWFRMYSEILQDPKVQRLPAGLFKHWVNLLALANTVEPRGTLPELEDIAFALRVKPTEAAAILTKLVERGLLDQSEDGQISAHNWSKRQRDSDDSAPRVQRHRVKSRGALSSNGANLPEGCNVTSPVTETPPEAETDTDSDAENAAADARTHEDDQAPDAAGLRQVERQFCVLAGKTMASPKDIVAMTRALELARGHPDRVVSVMRSVMDRRRKNGERGRVTSFSYFLSAVEEANALPPERDKQSSGKYAGLIIG